LSVWTAETGGAPPEKTGESASPANSLFRKMKHLARMHANNKKCPKCATLRVEQKGFVCLPEVGGPVGKIKASL
jgi:hypothetical protein